jgi:LmeA-like phospholipid-binding
VSEYPNQPRSQTGWPAQPPQYTGYEQDRYEPRDGDPRLLAGPARGPRRRRRRGRGWIALLITLIVLAVLFVVGDQVAKAYAQNMIASKIQSSAALASKPSVGIEGFPFLTQLAARDIRTVNITANNVQENKLDITSIKATATGVHINSGFNSATIDHISGTAFISFASLESAAGAQGATITADPSAGPNTVNVSFGPLSTTAQIVQTGPSQITVKMGSLGGIAAALIGSLPNYTIDIPKLPAGLQVQGVTVVSQGIDVNASAQNTTLSQ